jgi:hypothetical protein
MTAEQWRGMQIYASRSCGDCSHGPPCRCHPGQFMDLITEDERQAVEEWLACTSSFALLSNKSPMRSGGITTCQLGALAARPSRTNLHAGV